jgi:hypothetical protein
MRKSRQILPASLCGISHRVERKEWVECKLLAVGRGDRQRATTDAVRRTATSLAFT